MDPLLNLKLLILRRIYYEKSIWELESFNNFQIILKGLIERRLIFPKEERINLLCYPYEFYISDLGIILLFDYEAKCFLKRTGGLQKDH